MGKNGKEDCMKIPKSKAIELINEKIVQFEHVAENATYQNRFDEAYDLAYYGTEQLIKELFPQELASFRNNVSTHGPITFIGGPANPSEDLKDYKKHLLGCITQLKVYRQKVADFWSSETIEEGNTRVTIPFLSISFGEKDKEINDYIKGILDASGIAYKTGERYSKDSVPQKVKRRIIDSDLFVIIFVKRDKIETGGYTTPSWLIKELGIAQGAHKDVIAWVEKGIKDIAGLNYEKEVIYFNRDNIRDIQKATIKFLEALKAHNLI